MKTLNVSFYRFEPVAETRLAAWRSELIVECHRAGVRGTILLAREGVNAMLSGPTAGVRAVIAAIEREPGFQSLDLKESESDEIAFARLKVKIRGALIPGESPIAGRTGRRLAPETLKRWLDEGRPIDLIDVRNDFEHARGSFIGARAVGMTKFREFTSALEPQLAANARRDPPRPVVLFCTGGIRCEKASAWAISRGYEDIWQLEGGILRYFDRAGGAHWQGDCFVFDEREGLAPDSPRR